MVFFRHSLPHPKLHETKVHLLCHSTWIYHPHHLQIHLIMERDTLTIMSVSFQISMDIIFPLPFHLLSLQDPYITAWSLSMIRMKITLNVEPSPFVLFPLALLILTCCIIHYHFLVDKVIYLLVIIANSDSKLRSKSLDGDWFRLLSFFSELRLLCFLLCFSLFQLCFPLFRRICFLPNPQFHGLWQWTTLYLPVRKHACLQSVLW